MKYLPKLHYISLLIKQNKQYKNSYTILYITLLSVLKHITYRRQKDMNRQAYTKERAILTTAGQVYGGRTRVQRQRCTTQGICVAVEEEGYWRGTCGCACREVCGGGQMCGRWAGVVVGCVYGGGDGGQRRGRYVMVWQVVVSVGLSLSRPTPVQVAT